MRTLARLFLAVSFFVTGCAQAGFFWAKRLEKQGRFEQALKVYLWTAEKYPRNSMAPRALYEAGRVSGQVLSDYPLARDSFQRIIDKYGAQGDWGRQAEQAIFNTPNYFPLVDGAEWVEGDSDTGGKNAMVRIACRALEKEPGASLVRSYYAGAAFVKDLSSTHVYRKQRLELQEYDKKGNAVAILKYPFEKGASWTARREGRRWVYTIEGTATVETRAGVFPNCLKVREKQEGIDASWKVNYYAPGVGKVLTSLATASTEKRNTELISYHLAGGREIGAP